MPHANLIGKMVYRQLVGQYDWPLAEHHWRSQYVYMANMRQLPNDDTTPFIEEQVCGCGCVGIPLAATERTTRARAPSRWDQQRGRAGTSPGEKSSCACRSHGGRLLTGRSVRGQAVALRGGKPPGHGVGGWA